MTYEVIDLDEKLNLPETDVLWQKAPLCSAFMNSYNGGPRIRDIKAQVVLFDNAYAREHKLIPFIKYDLMSYNKEYCIWTIDTPTDGKLWGLRNDHWIYVFKQSEVEIPQEYAEFSSLVTKQNNRPYPTQTSRILEKVFVTQFRTVWNKKRSDYRKQNKELVETILDVQATKAQIAIMTKFRVFEAKLEHFKSKTESDKIYQEDFNALASAFQHYIQSEAYNTNLRLLPKMPKPSKPRLSKKKTV